MKKLLLIFGVCFFTGLGGFAQTDSGHLEVNHTFWGLRIKEGGQRIKLREAIHRMEQVPDAYEMMKASKVIYRQAQWLGVGTGVAIVYSLGTRNSKVERHVQGQRLSYNPVSIGVGIAGIGLAICGISLERKSIKKMKEAAAIYNQEKQAATKEQAVSWQLSIQPGGVGVRMSF